SLADFKGMGIYDPKSKQWRKLEGTHRGKKVIGHGVEQGGGTIHDFGWDPKTGDLWMVGASGLEDPELKIPTAVAPVIRVDAQGEFHAMGSQLLPEEPGKPMLVVESLYLDASVEPTAVY